MIPVKEEKIAAPQKQMIQRKAQPNCTGIPTPIKSMFEARSGFSFDDVRVHYNAKEPAQLQAYAYTQGNQVFIAPGQERHLHHELGHVVQQKQGIVHPTTSIGGVPVNDNAGLERQADTGAIFRTNNVEFGGNGVVQRHGIDFSQLDMLITASTPRPASSKVFKLKSPYDSEFTMHHLVSFNLIKSLYVNLASTTARCDFLIAALSKYLSEQPVADSPSPNAVPENLEAYMKMEITAGQINEYITCLRQMEEDNAYSAEIDRDNLIALVCWNPGNLVIGPLASIRLNDPGEAYDKEAAMAVGMTEEVAKYNQEQTVKSQDDSENAYAEKVKNVYLNGAGQTKFRRPTADTFTLKIQESEWLVQDVRTLFKNTLSDKLSKLFTDFLLEDPTAWATSRGATKDATLKYQISSELFNAIFNDKKEISQKANGFIILIKNYKNYFELVTPGNCEEAIRLSSLQEKLSNNIVQITAVFALIDERYSEFISKAKTIKKESSQNPEDSEDSGGFGGFGDLFFTDD